jgi:phosphoribosylaminoimidazole (AIR) synthetase
MGIGMIMVIDSEEKDEIIEELGVMDEKVHIIGQIVKGEKKVVLWNKSLSGADTND